MGAATQPLAFSATTDIESVRETIRNDEFFKSAFAEGLQEVEILFDPENQGEGVLRTRWRTIALAKQMLERGPSEFVNKKLGVKVECAGRGFLLATPETIKAEK